LEVYSDAVAAVVLAIDFVASHCSLMMTAHEPDLDWLVA
jgi:hypothetical protein